MDTQRQRAQVPRIRAWLDLDPPSDLAAVGHAAIKCVEQHDSLIDAIAVARAGGRSWTEIAKIFGITRQAVRQQFGREEQS